MGRVTDPYKIFFVLQTKKYADVIIPRGVDNMGKNQTWGSLPPSAPRAMRQALPHCSLVTHIVCYTSLKLMENNYRKLEELLLAEGLLPRLPVSRTLADEAASLVLRPACILSAETQGETDVTAGFH